MATPLYLSSEVVDVDEGLWCRECALPSGIRVYFVMRMGPSMSLRSFVRCRDCSGDQIDPS